MQSIVSNNQEDDTLTALENQADLLEHDSQIQVLETRRTVSN